MEERSSWLLPHSPDAHHPQDRPSVSQVPGTPAESPTWFARVRALEPLLLSPPRLLPVSRERGSEGELGPSMQHHQGCSVSSNFSFLLFEIVINLSGMQCYRQKRRGRGRERGICPLVHSPKWSETKSQELFLSALGHAPLLSPGWVGRGAAGT